MNNRILCTETIHGSCYYCYPHVLGFSISFIIFLFMQSSRINLFSSLEYVYNIIILMFICSRVCILQRNLVFTVYMITYTYHLYLRQFGWSTQNISKLVKLVIMSTENQWKENHRRCVQKSKSKDFGWNESGEICIQVLPSPFFKVNIVITNGSTWMQRVNYPLWLQEVIPNVDSAWYGRICLWKFHSEGSVTPVITVQLCIQELLLVNWERIARSGDHLPVPISKPRCLWWHTMACLCLFAILLPAERL